MLPPAQHSSKGTGRGQRRAVFDSGVCYNGVVGKTIACGCFEWDEEKKELNIKKHGISFEEAVAIFDDPYFLELRDDEHSTQEEERFLGVGLLRDTVIAMASVQSYTERGRTRIISARRAIKKEEMQYYDRGFR